MKTAAAGRGRDSRALDPQLLDQLQRQCRLSDRGLTVDDQRPARRRSRLHGRAQGASFVRPVDVVL